MQLRSDDIAVHAFSPSDGSPSAAVKVTHRPSGKETVDDSTRSQRTNFRAALFELVSVMNPSPEVIEAPDLVLFDEVRIKLPESIHRGTITDMTWDYTGAQWRFFVESGDSKVSNHYVLGDLELFEES